MEATTSAAPGFWKSLAPQFSFKPVQRRKNQTRHFGVPAKEEIRNCHQFATRSGLPGRDQQRHTEQSHHCQRTFTAAENRYGGPTENAQHDEQSHRHESSKARAKADDSTRYENMNQTVDTDQANDKQHDAQRSSQGDSEVNRRYICHQQNAKKATQRASDGRCFRFGRLVGHSGPYPYESTTDSFSPTRRRDRAPSRCSQLSWRR
jgi:hypothetical protein